MKEFEKWFDDVHRKGRGCYYDCNCAWRAALEEILSQLKRPIYSADIMKWIEKELEE